MNFSWERNLVVLWIGVFFCSMAYSISIPFLPIFLNTELGVEHHLEAWSGIAFGITFLASALISPFWGSLADKYGRKPMLIRSGFSLAALYLLNYFVHDPYWFLLIRIFQGLLAGFVPASIALVATNTPEEKTGYALGIMSTAGATGSILGPLAGGLVSHYIGNREAFLFSSAIVLISALVATFFAKEQNFNRKAVRSHVRDDLKHALANRPFMILLMLVAVSTFSVMILEPLITLYVLNMGISPDRASLSSGIIFSAVGIATVIMAPRWGKWGRKLGYQKVLLIGLIGGGIGNLLQIFVTGYIGFGVLRFGYGLFFAAVNPSINAMIVQHTESEFRGRAFSLNQSASQLATMAGPIIGGVLGGMMPIHYIFVINGSLLLLSAFLFKFKVKQNPAPVTSHQP
ncbi:MULTISPECIES: MFS transporter [Paenibacillus]|uniref:MFS transporter n=1 Tax=Paenibacillus lignilyticus TaxID=1172615 RepID=A0ABS5CKQ2_9BACL|nr:MULTISPECIES: MFS transporter [Paenibacillus]MBP3966439.1 MFS transporter [Paenibacillus lignilyticus]SFT28063.1 Predicted arabinose efflux permease, MFS family [Paenibacillus sp. BC26]